MKLSFKHTIYASYVGYITQAIVNNLAPLLFLVFKDTFGLPLSKITLLITINFLIQLTVDWLSSRFIDKIGYRKSIVTAHILAFAGLISMSVLPSVMSNPFLGLIISVIFYAVGGGIIEVLISPIVEACPTENKASAMSLLHSFYCWGTVAVVAISTVLLHIIGNWRLLPIFWAVIPIINAFVFLKVPINTLTDEGEGMTPGALTKSGLFGIFVILMVASGASEQAMSQWASAFAESGLGVSKAVGDIMGPCMFSLFMGVSRVITSKLTKSVDILNIMLVSGCLCVFSYLMAGLIKNPIPALTGCGICGFSVGVLWPGAFSLASKRFPKGGTALFALLALAGDVGCMSGPTLVGELAGIMGDNLSAGLLCAVIFPIILIICCLYLSKENTK